jgi:hypothetical protein
MLFRWKTISCETTALDGLARLSVSRMLIDTASTLHGCSFARAREYKANVYFDNIKSFI